MKKQTNKEIKKNLNQPSNLQSDRVSKTLKMFSSLICGNLALCFVLQLN